VFIQAEMGHESGACQTQNCVNDHPLDNITIRTAAIVSRTEVIQIADLTSCFVDLSGTVAMEDGLFFCIHPLRINDTFQWDLNDFDIYRLTSLGPAPDFQVPPGIYEAGEYPNTVSFSTATVAVAAVIDCEALPSSSPLRWGWRRPLDGPCYIDAEYNDLELCSPGGKPNNNAAYTNRFGDVLAEETIYSDVFCPT